MFGTSSIAAYGVDGSNSLAQDIKKVVKHLFTNGTGRKVDLDVIIKEVKLLRRG